jgi:two-component system nitrogen regulation sensor histidine kinase NtrY
MPEQEPSPTLRRPALIALAVGIAVLAFLLFSQTSLNLSFIQPDSWQQTLVLIALSALIFLLFVTLTFVLARNLLKLFAERRIGVLGSRFRTRMVLGGLALSFLPVIFMFLFAYVLMNRSIDKWFSRPVDELREDSGQVATLLSDYARRNAQAEAETLANLPRIQRAFREGDLTEAGTRLDLHDASLQGGFIVLESGKQQVSYHLPGAWSEVRPLVLASLHAADVKSSAPLDRAFTWKDKQYLAAVRDINGGGRVIVGMPLPPQLSATLQKIEQSQQRYFQLSAERKTVRRLFMQILLLITVVVLFASTWLSLFVARLVTRPVTALAEATKEISEGNLRYRVDITAADELGVLVSSFNRMAADLEENRRKLESSGREVSETNTALQAANAAIEQRRLQIETILENVPTGVLSLDAAGAVLHGNRSFSKLFHAPAQPGNRLADMFDPPTSADLDRLLRRSDRMATASREMDVRGVHVEVTVASLQHERKRQGYVMVFEDLTELLRAQKQVAWREVARRVAHEIKNPLTPIALSAERIRRHLDRGPAPDDASLAVIQGCAETITGAVETLRTLVDEFSMLARFPTAQPQPSNINSIVEGALGMFQDRLGGIQLKTDLAPGLPEVMADPESIKRVVANLVDNAAEAMRESLIREINISTALVSEDTATGKDAVEIVISDTGHGVTPELKEKLFLPYFSTKERGTGLGLAIVSRIVEEHQGSVRVEENRPLGTRFVVELPVANGHK